MKLSITKLTMALGCLLLMLSVNVFSAEYSLATHPYEDLEAGSTTIASGDFLITYDLSALNYTKQPASKFSLASDLDVSLSTGTVTTTVGSQTTPTAIIATTTGATTGTIAAGTSFVTVTQAASDNDIVILPAPVIGNIVWVYATDAFELRSSAPATIGINGGTGSNAESAITAGTLHRLVCTSATTWVGTQFAAVGTITVTEVAA